MGRHTSVAFGRRVTAAAIVLVATGCTGGADRDGARPLASGISGTTVVDIGCPTLPATGSCPTRPLPAQLRVTRSDTTTVAELTTPEDGTFTIELAPGSYQILATNLSGAPLPTAEPVSVEVTEGQITRVTVQFDSGVR